MVSKMSEKSIKKLDSPSEYEGNKGRFRICHPDIKNFQLIDYQLVGFFYCGYLVSKSSIKISEKKPKLHQKSLDSPNANYVLLFLP